MFDSKQCTAFLAVIQTSSFEGASQRLCITPSAVSIRIQALEESFGCVLLQRTRPCQPTEAGKKLLEYLNHNQRLAQDLIDSLNGNSNANSMQKLVIGVNADSLATWLLPILQPMLLVKNIVLELQLDDQKHTHHLLKSGAVNACISEQELTIKGCESIYLGNMRYQMMATKSFINRWFKEGVNPQSLCHAPAVIFNDKDQLHFNSVFDNFGIVKGRYPYHSIPSSDTFFSAIAMGIGYGLVPILQLTHRPSTDELIHITPDMYVDVPLYWHHWTQQSQALAELTQQIMTVTEYLTAYSPPQ